LCCDKGSSVYRIAKYPEYKSARKARRADEDARNPSNRARREEFLSDVDEFLETASIFGFDIIQSPGLEADDQIAYFCNHTPLEDNRLAILSSDTDLLQLIRPNIVQRALTEKMKLKPTDIQIPPKVWVNETRFKEAYQIEPASYMVVKALGGDTGDSITSPEGLGEMYALRLVQKYGTLDNIFAVAKENAIDIPRLPQKVKDALKLQENIDMIMRNVGLVNLRHGAEAEAELYPPLTRAKMDEVIASIGEPPEIDDTEIKELMFKCGKVRLYDTFEDWIKPFRGFIHS
jgi:5'-3' exonuclease